MVSNLSRRFSIVRAAMMPGIAHAKLERSGINDFPERPTPTRSLSIRKAARARYPQPSSTATKRKRIAICGRNMMTPPTPAMNVRLHAHKYVELLT